MRERPEALLFGFGAGATYELPRDASPYARALYASVDYRVHNIHNSYAAVLYRYGLAGVALLVGVLVAGLATAYRLVDRVRSPMAWFPLAGIAAYAAASPFFFFVPGDILFPIVLGMGAALLRLGPTQPQDAVSRPQ